MLRRTSTLVLSVLLHAGLLTLALLFWPKDEPVEIRIGSVPVSVVSDVIREAAPAPIPAEEQAEETPAETEAPAETPEPTPAPPRPTPPRPDPPTRPTPSDRPAERPQPRPDRPQPRPSRPEPEALNLDEIAGGGGRPRPDRPRPPGRPAGESGAGDNPVATGPEIAAIGRQINPIAVCGLAGADNLVIRISFVLDSNGRIVGEPQLVRPESGPVWRTAAERVLAAAVRAQPFDVPDGFRRQTLNFRYESARLCAGR